jgi:S-adenosylmethionine decarboxylase
MNTKKVVGRHLLIDAWGCPGYLLDNVQLIDTILSEAVAKGGGTLLNGYVHRFEPHGITAYAVLAESHMSLHTWPELEYFAADLFFCGIGNPHRALDSLCLALQPARLRVSRFERGNDATGFSMHIGTGLTLAEVSESLPKPHLVSTQQNTAERT